MLLIPANAAKVALGMGAQVTVLDISHDRLQYLDDVFHGRLQTRTSNEYNLLDVVIPVDYLDERKFARAAAARTGTFQTASLLFAVAGV